MPKRNDNNNRGRGGRGGGRGRGRGGANGVPTTVLAPASHAPHHRYPHASAFTDVDIQQWEPSESPDATVGGTNGNVNRGRGPWGNGAPKSRSGAGTPLRGFNSPRRASSTPISAGRGGRGRGRGQDPFHSSRSPYLGGGGLKIKTALGKDAPLSGLLYAERPLLRPVKFVRATLTPTLFEDAEDVLKPPPLVADTQKMSRVSAADRVAQLLHGTGLEFDPDSKSKSKSDDDALEEIDFADLAHVRAEIDAIAANGATTSKRVHKDRKRDIEEVNFADLMAIRAKVDAVRAQTQVTIQNAIIKETHDQYRDATQLSSTMDDRPHGVQELASPMLDESLDPKPSIEISNPSNHEPVTMQDTIVVEDALYPSNTLSNMLVEEPYEPAMHPIPTLTDIDIPLNPNPPSHDVTHPLFFIDAAPSRPLNGRSASDVILVDRTGRGETLGDQEEERIVYVAPHPRSGRAFPIPAGPRVKLPRTSLLTGRSIELGGLRSPVREDGAILMPEQDRTCADLEAQEAEKDQVIVPAAFGPTTFVSTSTQVEASRTQRSAGKARKKEMRLERKRQRQKKRSQLGFGASGAMISEARLRDEDLNEMRHPQWETRRRGDSDLDRGTEDEDKDEGREKGDEVEALLEGLGGMDIDPDLEIDMDAMQGFLKSMSVEGSRFVTMDDVEDKARIQQEDEESRDVPEGSFASEHSDDEELGEENEEGDEDEAFNVEEDILIGESDSAEELSEDSGEEEDGLSPKSNFQARLHKLRERSRHQDRKPVEEISDNEEEDEDEFMAYINDLLEKNCQVLSGGNRKQKKTVFRNLNQGYVGQRDLEALLDDSEFTTPVNKKEKKGKGKQATSYFAADLEVQWAKDRAKKAEYKRQRQDAQLLAALDPLSAAANGSRGISRKAMSAAARLDPAAALAIAPWAVVDTPSLVAQIRRFAEDVGASSLALPPMNKGLRKWVHEVACVFGMRSESKGKGNARYTTLYRTSRTRLAVNEGKVKALVKRYGKGSWGSSRGGKDGKSGKGGESGKGEGRSDKGQRMPKPREGDEVGKEAPKIEESNVGFRMLASMGWSEGGRIGGTASVGLEVPLTAIVKNSKLGLGAAR